MMSDQPILSSLEFLISLLDVCERIGDYATAANIGRNERETAERYKAMHAKVPAPAPPSQRQLAALRIRLERLDRFHRACYLYAHARSKEIKARIEGRRESVAHWRQEAIKASGQADEVAFYHDAELWEPEQEPSQPV